LKFLDANVFIYAYSKPKRMLTEEERKIKKKSQEILERVNKGEAVITTLIHLSEVANVLERAVPVAGLSRLLKGILSTDNVNVLAVSREDYLAAADAAPEQGIGVNDALAVIKMKETGVSEIYSFDKHFDVIEGIIRAK
jgi:predicted nucleic acid-binding protein